MTLPSPTILTGYRGDPLTFRFVQQTAFTDRLGVLLPGLGYGIKHPGLLYPAQMLQELGFDTFALDTRYSSAEFRDASENEQGLWLQTDVLAAYRMASAARDYREFCVVAKSLGTIGLHFPLSTRELSTETRLVWLTPLLTQAAVTRSILNNASRSLVVIGTEDPDFSPERIETLERAGVELLVLDGADHSFNLPSDTLASVDCIRRRLEGMQKFCCVS